MVLQGYVTFHHPGAGRVTEDIVFDIYDPLHLETLALTTRGQSQVRDDHVRLSVRTLNRQLQRADFMVCASDSQRDLLARPAVRLGGQRPHLRPGPHLAPPHRRRPFRVAR